MTWTGRWTLVLCATAWLAACAMAPGHPAVPPDADVLLLGELHDDPAHQRRHRQVVASLAAEGRLAALAIEMAEAGTSTAGLPPDASEAEVRTALRWNEDGWPWATYGPAIMAAVRAGAPVRGANLPRTQMRPAMQDASLDGALDARALAAQREAVRAGHCDLLPPQQLPGMVRVQVARDRAMARVVAEALSAGRTVVLLAGAAHVDPAVGVPRHLPEGLRVLPVVLARSGEAPARDPCAELREHLQRGRR